jgi:2-haloacid dehalogenase
MVCGMPASEGSLRSGAVIRADGDSTQARVRDDVVVTFDLFSALIDSRTGGAAALGRIAAARGWTVGGGEVYDRWDATNKRLQRDCRRWVPYRVLAARALADVHGSLGLAGDAVADVDALLESLPGWPLWPDVADGLPALRSRFRVGLLSNVDDDLLARTRAAPLVDPALALTSERLRAYKPGRRIYREAGRLLGPMVHVATSARDVRGALEAGLPVVRLVRPGHELDPEGPSPAHEARTVAELGPLLERAARG